MILVGHHVRGQHVPLAATRCSRAFLQYRHDLAAGRTDAVPSRSAKLESVRVPDGENTYLKWGAFRKLRTQF